jgi:hypothetical protein
MSAEHRVQGPAGKGQSAGILGSLLVLLVNACGTTSVPTVDAAPLAGECVLVPAPASAADTIRVALSHGVDFSHAPTPHSYSDQLLYRQLYQTLIRVNCTGTVLSGLAQSWSRKDEGLRWSFVLRRDARFWDDTPLTAALLIASWRATGAAERHGLEPDSLFVTGERELEVVFSRPHRSVPSLFASPDLAVVKWSESVTWPIGTGPYRIVEYDSRRVFAVAFSDRGTGSGPALEFRVVQGRDPRDVIDDRFDLLVTSDARALDYAVTQPDRDLVALPWDVTYVVATPTSTTGEGRPGTDSWNEIGLSKETREALARDAVRAEARAATPPLWWDELDQCEAILDENEPRAPTRRSGSNTARVAFESSDAVARDLAERLVALGGAPNGRELLLRLRVDPALAASVSTGGTRLQTAALDAESFRQALLAGQNMAYILSLPRLTANPCRSAADLATRTGWIVRRGSSPVGPSQLQLSRSLVPLVDTRRQAIVYRGRIGLAIDWDGTPVLYLP